jgi:crossover junction endodeoxyribonuclease RusA
MILTFACPTRPLSVNVSNGRHWASNRRLTDPWKDATFWTTRSAMARGRWTVQRPITVQVDLPFRGARRRDPHNYVGTNVKAVVDGLVQAGVVPDDTPEWVTVLEPVITVNRDKTTPLMVTVTIQPRESTP